MALNFRSGKFVFVVGFLSAIIEAAISQEVLPLECAPEEVRHCYRDYSPHLRRSSVRDGSEGSITNADLTRWCSEINAKIYCHRRIALCPEDVRSNFSRQERGYEALRNLFCDENAIRDYYTARSCQDPQLLFPCRDKYTEGLTPGNTKTFSCKLSQAATECYELAFTSRCGMPLHLAEAAYFRGERALMLLSDCNGSTSTHVISEKFMMAAAAALALLRWAGLSLQLRLKTE